LSPVSEIANNRNVSAESRKVPVIKAVLKRNRPGLNGSVNGLSRRGRDWRPSKHEIPMKVGCSANRGDANESESVPPGSAHALRLSGISPYLSRQ